VSHRCFFYSVDTFPGRSLGVEYSSQAPFGIPHLLNGQRASDLPYGYEAGLLNGEGCSVSTVCTTFPGPGHGYRYGQSQPAELLQPMNWLGI
jgi:hypothetical protein